MVGRHHRNALEQALSSANDESIGSVSSNWHDHSRLLDEVSRSIRQAGRRVDSEIEGQAGVAMVAKFIAISDRLDEDSARMEKGSEALGIAQAAAFQAIQTRHGLMLSDPMNQPPTKPAGPTPGTQPTPEQQTAMGQYNARLNAYLATEQAAEDKARMALEHLDGEYARAADLMREIHGEPDPVDTPAAPAAGGGSGGGGGGGGVPNGPVSPPGTPGGPDVRDPRGARGFELVQVRDPHESSQVEVRDPHHPDRTPTGGTSAPTGDAPHHPSHAPPYHPSTNVGGGTDGGFDYSPTSSGGAGPSAPTAAGGGGPSGPGMAAGGLAGGAAGAAGMRGSAAAAPLRSAGVQRIGATTRPSAPGSLGRAAGPGTPGALGPSGTSRGASVGGSARAGSAGSTGRTGGARSAAAAGGRSGAAAQKGPASGVGQGQGRTQGKGKGLFRRGGNGSVTGARGGRKDDERTEQRDALVYEQDWLGDESAGTGVLD